MQKKELELKIKELEELIKDKKDNGVYGSLTLKHIACGKDGCKCKDGYRHGPYSHIQLYDNKGVLRGIYIGNKRTEEYKNKLIENNKLFAIIKELNKLYKIRLNLNY